MKKLVLFGVCLILIGIIANAVYFYSIQPVLYYYPDCPYSQEVLPYADGIRLCNVEDMKCKKQLDESGIVKIPALVKDGVVIIGSEKILEELKRE